MAIIDSTDKWWIYSCRPESFSSTHQATETYSFRFSSQRIICQTDPAAKATSFENFNYSHSKPWTTEDKTAVSSLRNPTAKSRRNSACRAGTADATGNTTCSKLWHKGFKPWFADSFGYSCTADSKYNVAPIHGVSQISSFSDTAFWTLC